MDELYRRAAVATAAGTKSFYFATRFFPKEKARAAHAVYWFCRHTDDLADECASVEQGRADLAQWSGMLEAAFESGDSGNEILRCFVDTVRRYGIPHEYARELLRGMQMDLDCTRYGSFQELRVFCYRVASVVGLMMSHVIGFEGDALPFAIDLGIAMQLTNILRDIGEDLGRGRVYLPADELREYGYSEGELRGRVRNAAFRELMAFECERARQYYRAAEPGIRMLSRDGRFAVKVASDVYQAILDRIESSDYDVFEQRAVVPATRKYWLTARAMAGPIAQSLLTRHA